MMSEHYFAAYERFSSVMAPKRQLHNLIEGENRIAPNGGRSFGEFSKLAHWSCDIFFVSYHVKQFAITYLSRMLVLSEFPARIGAFTISYLWERKSGNGRWVNRSRSHAMEPLVVFAF
jgi:hypothetical protein